MKKLALRSLALLTTFAAPATLAYAQVPSGSQAAFMPTTIVPQPSGGAFTMGFSFTANTDTFLNGLGAFDLNSDGFAAPITVGLWNNAGALLTQATVTSSSTLLDSFRYTLVPSYQLQAGTTYVVGAFRYAGSGETYATAAGSGSSAPGISFVQARYNDSGAFAFPNLAVNTGGYFGANALIGNRVEVAGGVPEPATWATLILGFGAVGGAMRRRRSAIVRFT